MGHLNKIIAVLLITLSVTWLCAALVPEATAAPEDIKILSFSWYIAPTTSTRALPGDLVVVGEVQNTGSSTVQYVTLQGLAFTSDGQAQAGAYTPAFVDNLLPQQKAPFYMDFNIYSSFSGNMSWVPLVSRVEINVVRANATDSYQYPNLALQSNTSYIDMNGAYTVVGILQNTGSESTGKVWVVGTFYNASGTVIGTGFSNFLTPDFLAPNATGQFAFSPLDLTTDQTAKISSYSLLIQTQQVIPEFSTVAVLAALLIGVTLVVAVFSRRG